MADIAHILREHLQEVLDEDRKQHLSTPYGRPIYASGYDSDHLSPVDADLETVGDFLGEAREALATRNVRHVQHLVAGYVEKYGVPETRRTELALGLLKANVQALETSRRRLLEGVADDIELDGLSRASLAERPPAARAVDASPKLSSVVDDYTEIMGNEGGWRGQTMSQSNTTFRMFIECVGDLPVGSYERSHLDMFYQLLRRLPAMYGKAKLWRDMAPAKIAEATRDDASIKRLTMKTMKRHFSSLGGLFTYAYERGLYKGSNPAHGFRFPQKGKANARRQMWSGDKLQLLFASPVWTGCLAPRQRSKPGDQIIKDEKYWLPLLGLYHGNRLEEFAQLRRSDVRCEGGIWYFDINDDDNKQIKNDQSKRKVPIHPEIQRLGFIGYVEAVAVNVGEPLFPQLTPGGADKKYGHAFTKWWTRYRQEIGLYESGLDYHSFRHGVTTKLTAEGVSAALIDQLTGHAGTGTSQKVYTKDLALPLLFEAISKVAWPEVIISST